MALESLNIIPNVAWDSLILLLALPVLVGIVCFVLIRRKRAVLQLDNEAENSFFYTKVAYTTERDSEVLRQGYLRSLTSERATLVVSDRAVRKGSQLTLNLGQLKSSDGVSAAPVKGKVTHTKSLGGSPENLLVNIQFLEQNVPMRGLQQQQSEFVQTVHPH